MVVYLDLVMGLNFLVDFLLILGTNRLSGFPISWGRAVGASVLGGIYGGVCLLPEFRFLGNPLWRMVTLGLMASIAFGWDISGLRRCGVFVLLTMALGGLALGMGNGSVWTTLACGAGLWLLCRVAFGDGVGERIYVPLEIAFGESRVHLTALRDSGNTLRDPVTNQQVLVISAEAACRLTGLTMEQLRRPMETLTESAIPGLRLIPYHTVGGSGMLLAKRFEDVKIGSRRQQAVVAFDTGSLGKSEGYQALTGGVI